MDNVFLIRLIFLWSCLASVTASAQTITAAASQPQTEKVDAYVRERMSAALNSEKLLKRASLEQMWSNAKLNNGQVVASYGLGFGLTSFRGASASVTPEAVLVSSPPTRALLMTR